MKAGLCVVIGLVLGLAAASIDEAMAAEVRCEIVPSRAPVDCSLGGYFKQDRDWTRSCQRS